MHHEQFIAQLAHRLDLPKLRFNDDYVCRLVLDGRHVVDLEWVDRDAAIYLYSVVHTRAASLVPRYAELLSGNLFGRGTHDAVLGLDVDRDEIVLTRRFELDHLDLEWFVQQLGSFVESVSDWSQRLELHHGSRDSLSPREPDAIDPLVDHATSGLLRV